MGNEPDQRNTLANERTMLAWIRTSLGLLASGVALLALTLPVSDVLRVPAALVPIVAGIAASWHGWRGWQHAERALRRGGRLPSPWIGLILAVLVGCSGVLLLLGLVLHAASV